MARFNNILIAVYVLTLISLLAAGLIAFVYQVRAGQMPWKRSARFGVLFALLALLGALNNLPLVYGSYNTSRPLAVWNTVLAVGVIVVPIVGGLLAWLLIGCAVSFYPDAWKVLSGAARRVWRRDALVALVLSLAAGAGLAKVGALITSAFHAYAPIKDDLFPAIFASLWPAAGFFLSSLTHTLVYAGLMGLAIFIVRAGWKQRAWWLWAMVALVLISLGPSEAHSLAEFGVGWLLNFLPLLAAAGIVGFFLRDNILAYLMVLFGVQVAEPLVNLFGQSNKYFMQNGATLALLAAAVLLWMLWAPDVAREVKE